MQARRAALIGAGALIAIGFLALPGVRAHATGCGRPEDAPGFGTPARPGVVPDTVCMDLQLAQDKSEAAGYHDLGSQDATGRGRHQVWDRDWVVVSQNPAPGTKAPPRNRVVFRVLAYGDPGAPPAPDRARPGPLPCLTCFDLQEAEDTLQSAGFTRMASEDASGRGRHQIVDRNWTVTGRARRPAGTFPKPTRVVPRAVKDVRTRSCG